MRSTNTMSEAFLRRGFGSGGLVLFFIFALASHAAAQTCIQSPEGIIAWWPGDNADDISGNANHAQLQNGATAGVPGHVGGTFQFDGVNDVAQTAVILPQQGTIEFWLNPASLSAIHGIIGTVGIANGDDRLWLTARGPLGGLGVGPNNLVVNTGSCCVNEIITPSPLVVSTWTHLALTFDYLNDVYTLYINGQFAAASTAPRNTPTQPLSFGGLLSNFGQFFFFDGLMDEVTVYDRVLDAAELLAIFEAGSAGKCAVTTVTVDIKPGSLPNSINPKSKGKLPVAILTTNAFDATTMDPTTVRFGQTGTEAAPVQSALEDVDGDGDIDMILHFNTQDTGMMCGDTSASLTGETFSEQAIQGTDAIKTVACQ